MYEASKFLQSDSFVVTNKATTVITLCLLSDDWFKESDGVCDQSHDEERDSLVP